MASVYSFEMLVSTLKSIWCQWKTSV